MTLIKTSLLSAIAVLVKLLTLLGINKVLAIYVGPSGYAVIGQFQNAIQMISIFASGAINTGVTKYTAELHDNEYKQQQVWKTAGSISLGAAFISAIIIIIFNQELSIVFFNDNQYSSIFTWLAVSLVFLVFNSLLLAMLNGKKEIGRYVLANISGSVFALLSTCFMTVFLGLYGALLALAVYQSISFFITLYLCFKTSWFKLRFLFGAIDKNAANGLLKYMVMALASAICLPLSQLIVRDQLTTDFGAEFAGYWEAMSRLSSAYLMLMTTTLSVYYLPKLSELNKTEDLRYEILQGVKVIAPLTMLFAIIIYIARDLIINILFSESFLPMRELFLLQLIGDTLKVCSWIFSYFILSKAMTKIFIGSEIVFSLAFVLLVSLLTELVGFKGVVLAHAVNYFFYSCFFIFITWHVLKSDKSKV